MKKKFVLITMQRSGSNMLVSILDEHPEIRCFGELMRKTPDWMRVKGYKGALSILNDLDPKYKDDEVRFGNPYEFLEDVYEHNNGEEIVGFKLHVEQHRSLLERLIHDPEYKIVILERSNILAQYSSWKIAEVTGQGNAAKGVKTKQATVEFNPQNFVHYINRVKLDYQWLNDLLGKASKKHFHILYTELINREKIIELMRFLEVRDVIVPDARTQKRNPSRILDRFSNPNDVEKTLVEINCQHWTYESMSP